MLVVEIQCYRCQ